MITRRGLLLGALAAPVVVKAASLMVIRKPLVLPPRIGTLRQSWLDPVTHQRLWEDTALRQGDVTHEFNLQGLYSVSLPAAPRAVGPIHVEVFLGHGRILTTERIPWEHGPQRSIFQSGEDTAFTVPSTKK